MADLDDRPPPDGILSQTSLTLAEGQQFVVAMFAVAAVVVAGVALASQLPGIAAIVIVPATFVAGLGSRRFLMRRQTQVLLDLEARPLARLSAGGDAPVAVSAVGDAGDRRS